MVDEFVDPISLNSEQLFKGEKMIFFQQMIVALSWMQVEKYLHQFKWAVCNYK